MKCKPVKKLTGAAEGITIFECFVPGAKNRDFQAVDMESHDLIGTLGVDEFKGDFIASAIEVSSPGSRRKRVGTRLYEEANAYACRQKGRLLSDTTRSPFAENFWRKQVQKGRAMCVEDRTATGAGGRFYPVWEDEHMDIQSRERGNLPQPDLDAHGRPFWPCRRFGVTTPCEVSTLEGVRRKAAKKRRTKRRRR